VVRSVRNGRISRHSQIRVVGVNMHGSDSMPLETFDYALTCREKQILQLFIDGYSMQEVADMLFVSYTTINSHLKHLHRKLNVTNRAELVAKAIREALV
jgi:DNA-binding CsgD family transcriptional regulator